MIRGRATIRTIRISRLPEVLYLLMDKEPCRRLHRNQLLRCKHQFPGRLSLGPNAVRDHELQLRSNRIRIRADDSEIHYRQEQQGSRRRLLRAPVYNIMPLPLPKRQINTPVPVSSLVREQRLLRLGQANPSSRKQLGSRNRFPVHL
jgi:hypothetical protein